jgi:hypothetical protein
MGASNSKEKGNTIEQGDVENIALSPLWRDLTKVISILY